jgi:HD-like signal output (HDOD) protein
MKVKASIHDWIEQLTESSMPIFSGTVGKITSVINSSESSASDVAHVVLQDASLTSRLLKLANSFAYNPLGQDVSTISRAVMVLGFERIKSLTLSLVLIDSLAKGVQRNHLILEMADAFHSAMQAEALAKAKSINKPENVFVTSLLSRIGNMAFWAFASDEQAAFLDQLLQEGMDEAKAERKVLGFALTDLTKDLSQKWALSESLNTFLAGEANEYTDLIKAGRELAITSREGWNGVEAKQVIESTARKLNKPYLDIEDLAFSTAKNAKKVTHLYGSTEISNNIPQANALTDDAVLDLEVDAVEVAMQEESKQQKEIKGIQANPQLQLTIMQDIANAIEEKPSLNIILEMVLEGIHRGVGMDRCLFAILAPDRRRLLCKFALGTNNEQLCKELIIPLASADNVFLKSAAAKKAVHIDSSCDHRNIPEQVITLVGTPPYLVMPAIVKGKVIGLFMADRNESNREIEEKDFIAFQQLCQQANMGMTFLTSKG